MSIHQCVKRKKWCCLGLNTRLNFTKVSNSKSTIPARILEPMKTSEGCFSIPNYKSKFLMALDGMIVYYKNKKWWKMEPGSKSTHFHHNQVLSFRDPNIRINIICFSSLLWRYKNGNMLFFS